MRSKADFKSKSQNIWQEIILCSSTVMQMICAWHKIWTLSGKLSLMCNVQLMNIYIYRYIYIYIYISIFRVYYIRIIAKQRLVHTTWNMYSSIIIVRNVYVLNTASTFAYLFFTRSWSLTTTENVLLFFGGNVINTRVLH
jgi:hypothetical protein